MRSSLPASVIIDRLSALQENTCEFYVNHFLALVDGFNCCLSALKIAKKPRKTFLPLRLSLSVSLKNCEMSCKRFVYHFLRFVANFRLQTHTHMNEYTHSLTHTLTHSLTHRHFNWNCNFRCFNIAHCGKRPQNAFPLDSRES